MEWLGLHCQSPSIMVQAVDHLAISSFSSSPLQAELLATLEAIRWSIRHNFVAAYIFTDCYNAVIQIAGTSDFHYSNTFLLHNLEKEISKLSLCKISKVQS
ncbi:hypothetical protein RHMOL_Rhmol05G0224000 [Rhododendron molle]|uniref:Uncharacterized protein n=1 Tax=Rhododendron molle TaxID=49168 RepID=A0ACC0NTD9_RHOML|nr:hypothetical protein RHMOL_Rhmol05G0224000 [Rhododendron molle]